MNTGFHRAPAAPETRTAIPSVSRGGTEVPGVAASVSQLVGAEAKALPPPWVCRCPFPVRPREPGNTPLLCHSFVAFLTRGVARTKLCGVLRKWGAPGKMGRRSRKCSIAGLTLTSLTDGTALCSFAHTRSKAQSNGRSLRAGSTEIVKGYTLFLVTVTIDKRERQEEWRRLRGGH